jgi:hypothetical protein
VDEQLPRLLERRSGESQKFSDELNAEAVLTPEWKDSSVSIWSEVDGDW